MRGGSGSSFDDIDSQSPLAAPRLDGFVFRRKRRKHNNERFAQIPMDEDLPVDNAQLQQTVLGLCNELSTALLKMRVQEQAQMHAEESPKIELGNVPTVESLLGLFF